MATLTLPDVIRLEGRRKTPEEDQALKVLDTLFDEAKRAKDHWVKQEDIDRDLKLYRGQVGPPNREPHFKANFVEAFIDRMTAQLTDNRPIIRVESRKDGLKGVADVANKVVRAIWDDEDVQRQTFKMCHNAAVTRSSGFYTGYDPLLDQVVLELVPISQVWIDPAVSEAARVSKHAEYVIIERIRSLEEVKARFGRRADGLTADSDIDVVPQERRSVASPLTDIVFGRRLRGGMGVPRIKLREHLLRDWAVSTENGSVRLSNPGGRILIRSKDRLLYAGPNPYWDSEFCLDWFDWRVDPQHPWGASEPDRLRHLQISFNEIMDGLVENQLLSNFLALVADFDAFSPETWTKLQQISSSLILRKQNRNASAVLTPPPTFGADKIALARQLFTFAQLLTGVTDVTLGESPGSLQSGVALEGLQEGANLMTRSRASRLEDFFARIGQKLLARIFQFMTSDRVVSLVGPTGAALEYAIKRQEFFTRDDGNAIPEHERRQVFRDLRFVVSPGSSAIGSRVRRVEATLKLKEAGVASSLDVLQAGDFPEPEGMIERAKKELMEMAPVLNLLGSRRGPAS
jgi:hypothetical protein